MERWPNGISVVIMGRDEEQFLALTLPPLRQVADEIIFVDTGSQDRTLALAESFGCRIFHQPWQEDFSAPKNYGIEQAQFAWIFNVDCDELLLHPEQARKTILALNETEEQNSAPGWIIQIDNLTASGESVPSKALRLFRNDARIRFNNPIHEGVADALYRHWPHTPPTALNICLRHYGYQAGVNKEKLGRNMAILRKWVQQEPENVYGCFKLGANLRHRGSGREGLFFLERAFNLLSQATDKNSYPFLENLVSTYYQSLLENGMQEKAMELRKQLGSWN